MEGAFGQSTESFMRARRTACCIVGVGAACSVHDGWTLRGGPRALSAARALRYDQHSVSGRRRHRLVLTAKQPIAAMLIFVAQMQDANTRSTQASIALSRVA